MSYILCFILHISLYLTYCVVSYISRCILRIALHLTYEFASYTYDRNVYTILKLQYNIWLVVELASLHLTY